MNTQEVAARIVEELLADLYDRKGFDDLWDEIDPDTQQEMRLTWQDLTVQVLTEAGVTDKG